MTEPRANLEELKAAEAAATPGRWRIGTFRKLNVYADGIPEAIAIGSEVRAWANEQEVANDMNLIALMRNALPALIAEVEALRKQVYSLEPDEDGTGGMTWEAVAFYNAAVIDAAEDQIRTLEKAIAQLTPADATHSQVTSDD